MRQPWRNRQCFCSKEVVLRSLQLDRPSGAMIVRADKVLQRPQWSALFNGIGTRARLRCHLAYCGNPEFKRRFGGIFPEWHLPLSGCFRIAPLHDRRTGLRPPKRGMEERSNVSQVLISLCIIVQTGSHTRKSPVLIALQRFHDLSSQVHVLFSHTFSVLISCQGCRVTGAFSRSLIGSHVPGPGMTEIR